MLLGKYASCYSPLSVSCLGCCSVIFFDGLWHLISPDHTNIGVGFYATSQDGLTFERQENLFFEGGAWLGNMIEHEGEVFFVGTGFTLKTNDFAGWQLVDRRPSPSELLGDLGVEPLQGVEVVPLIGVEESLSVVEVLQLFCGALRRAQLDRFELSIL